MKPGPVVTLAALAGLLLVPSAASGSILPEPAERTAVRTVIVPIPDPGTISFARVVLTGRWKDPTRTGPVPLPKARVTNGKDLPDSLTIIHAVKRAKAGKNRFVVEVVMLNRATAAAPRPARPSGEVAQALMRWFSAGAHEVLYDYSDAGATGVTTTTVETTPPRVCRKHPPEDFQAFSRIFGKPFEEVTPFEALVLLCTPGLVETLFELVQNPFDQLELTLELSWLAQAGFHYLCALIGSVPGAQLHVEVDGPPNSFGPGISRGSGDTVLTAAAQQAVFRVFVIGAYTWAVRVQFEGIVRQIVREVTITSAPEGSFACQTFK